MWSRSFCNTWRTLTTCHKLLGNKMFFQMKFQNKNLARHWKQQNNIAILILFLLFGLPNVHFVTIFPWNQIDCALFQWKRYKAVFSICACYFAVIWISLSMESLKINHVFVWARVLGQVVQSPNPGLARILISDF